MMNAVVGYSDESVEDVRAALDARQRQAEGRHGRGRHGDRTPRDVTASEPPPSALKALEALVAQAKAVQQDADE